MSPGMPKEAGSLNGPLCAYLMRQNLHNRNPRSYGNECPCQVRKWSVKNCGRESINGGLSALSPAHQFGLRQYPAALKGCGVNKFTKYNTLKYMNVNFALQNNRFLLLLVSYVARLKYLWQYWLELGCMHGLGPSDMGGRTDVNLVYPLSVWN